MSAMKCKYTDTRAKGVHVMVTVQCLQKASSGAPGGIDDLMQWVGFLSRPVLRR